MPALKADIITQLKKEILNLQGFTRPSNNNSELNSLLGSIKYTFPNSSFPLGAMHEFICNNPEDISASSGFIAGILSVLMKKSGVSIWISPSQTIFPPALKSFNIAPDKIIFINLKNEKDILWTTEEALKCEGLSAVICEIRDLNFTTSRRLQLAVEQSRVTGFILCSKPKNITTTACVTRWKITHLPCITEDEIPGVSFPRWNVELIKVRNGKPGTWSLQWINQKFKHIPARTSIISPQKKTG